MGGGLSSAAGGGAPPAKPAAAAGGGSADLDADLRVRAERAEADARQLRAELAQARLQLAEAQARADAAFEAGRRAGIEEAQAAATEAAPTRATASAAPPADPPLQAAKDAGGAPAYDVYASFAADDAPAAMRYVRGLREAGLFVCVARESGGPQDGMAASRAFVCFLSSSFLRDAACDAELRRAHAAFGGASFPVFLASPKELDLPSEYRMMLTSVNWTVPADGSDAAADAACAALVAGLRKGRTAPPAPAAGQGAAPSAAHPAPHPPSDGPAKEYDAFVSYAHRDSAAVLRYVERLERAGISVWVDRELLPGRRWMEDIANAMKRSRTFLCFLSQAYADSQNCDDEFQFAHHQLRVPKFPLFLGDPGAMRLRADQEMMIGSVQRTVQSGPGERAADQACDELVAKLRAMLEEQRRRAEGAAAARRAAALPYDEFRAWLEREADAARERAVAAARAAKRLVEVDPAGGLAAALWRHTAPGLTFLLQPGRHELEEALVLDRDVTLVGPRGAVLECSLGPAVHCKGPAAPAIVGLSLRGRSDDDSAVYISGGSQALIVGCDVSASSDGFEVRDEGTAPALRLNVVRGCATGALFTRGAKGLLEANDMHANAGPAAATTLGADPAILANRVHDQLSGIAVWKGEGNPGRGLVGGNVLERVGAGISVDDGCAPTVEGNELREARAAPSAEKARRVTAGEAACLVDALREAHREAKEAAELSPAPPGAEEWLSLLREAWLRNANAKSTPALVVDARRRPYCPARIGEALATATDNQTVYVAPGSYEETVLLDRPWRLKIVGTRDAVLRGPAGAPALVCSGPATSLVLGISIRGGEGAAAAVRLCDGSRATLESCDVAGAAVGVAATGPLTAPQLRGVSVHDCGESGLLFEDGARGTAEACELAGNGGPGARLADRADAALLGCHVRGNGEGVLIEGPGTLGRVEGCEIADNRRCAVRVRAGADPVVRGNTARGQPCGLCVQAGGRGTIAGNTVEGAQGPPVEVEAGCSPLLRDNASQ